MFCFVILPQVAGLDTSSALGAFERMEEKVMSLEAQAEAVQMVSRILVLLFVLLLRNGLDVYRAASLCICRHF